MHIKQKLYKIKSIYIYIALIIVAFGISYVVGTSKYNYSEIKSIIIVGEISGQNILPQQAISLVFSNPAYLNQDNSNFCYIDLTTTEKINLNFSYQIVSDTVGIIRIKSHDIDWLKDNGNDCIKKIINAINQQELLSIKNKRYDLNLKSYKISENNNLSFNLTKEYGMPVIIRTPEINNKYKVIILGLILGLFLVYGISKWLKNN